MKTLNEIIKAFSEVNKEVGCGDCQFNDAESDDIPCELPDCIFNDALHYLKMYRSDQIQWEADRKLWTDKLKELEIGTLNPPLTWDELKQMEGKPVWIEGPLLTEEPHWIILGAVHLYEGKIVGYGKTWQAYRKERK